jgi:hypothetical protein
MLKDMLVERFVKFLAAKCIQWNEVVNFSIEVRTPNSLLPTSSGQQSQQKGSHKKIILFGFLELDLPTSVSHPPSLGTRMYTCIKKIRRQLNQLTFGISEFVAH